jgi:hypothetical protein
MEIPMLLDWKKVYLTVWLTLPASSYYIANAAILCIFWGTSVFFSSNVFVPLLEVYYGITLPISQ